jgi:hypothetical protein
MTDFLPPGWLSDWICWLFRKPEAPGPHLASAIPSWLQNRATVRSWHQSDGVGLPFCCLHLEALVRLADPSWVQNLKHFLSSGGAPLCCVAFTALFFINSHCLPWRHKASALFLNLSPVIFTPCSPVCKFPVCAEECVLWNAKEGKPAYDCSTVCFLCSLPHRILNHLLHPPAYSE